MSSPRIASSAFIGAGWFALLLAACMVAEDRNLPKSAARVTAVDNDGAVQPPPTGNRTTRDPAREIADLLNSRSGSARPPATDGATKSLVPQPNPTIAARPVTPASQPEPPDAGSRSTGTGTRFIEPAPEAAAHRVPVLPPPAELSVPSVLQLAVDAPDAVVEHEPALLTIHVMNPGSLSAGGVVVRARFDEGWEFPGSEELEIEQRLGGIPANSSCESTLSLIPLRGGRNPIEFRVESDSHPPVAEMVSIDVQPRTVELGLAGPSRRAVGRRVEYVVTVRNTSGHDLSEARANVEYDPAALSVREASVGFHHEPGTIAWPLGTLLRDERVQIQLEFECLAVLLPTPVRCSFVAADRTAAVREQSLEIVPATPIDVAVNDDDPCTVGATARFTVHVRNGAASAVEGLELRIATSPHFENLTSVEGAGSRSAQLSQDAYGIDVENVRLPTGGEVTFTFSATATQPGDGAVRVLVRAPGLPAPFEVEESFVINPTLNAE